MTRWCCWQEQHLFARAADTVVDVVSIENEHSNAVWFLTSDWHESMLVLQAQHLLKRDGLFVGSSAAINCVGAVKVARALGPGHVIVTILCDGGHR